MSQKKWQAVAIKSTALLVLLVAMVFSFQNCGKAGFDQTALQGDESSLDADPKLATLPFPYDVTVNQAAFMSCQFRGTDPNAINPYFSFKVGAYDNDPGSTTYSLYSSKAGLTVRPEFVDEFNRIGAIFNPTFRPTKYKEGLTALPSVANTRLQLSLRQLEYPQNELMRLPSVGNYGGGETPVKNFLAPVTSDAISETFKAYMGASEQPVLNYFQAAGLTGERSLEASLLVPWGSNDGGVEYYGPLVNSYRSSYLTVGFAKDAKNLASEGTDGTTAYAQGLKPEFSFYYNSPVYGLPLPPHGAANIAMTRLSEFNLSTGSPIGSVWKCSDASQKLMAFKIVKNADRFTKIHRAKNFSWPNLNQPGTSQTASATCPGVRYSGQYCPSPDNPRVFGRALTEFPTGSGGFLCPTNRRLLPASAVATGEPPVGQQLNNRTFHAFGEFCEEQYEYACPPEPMFPVGFIAGQPPASENAYLTSSPEKLAIYHALRRFLPESDWDINVSKRCIVEKQGQDSVCYASTARPVIYDEYFFPESAAVAGRDQANPSLGRYLGCGPGEYGDCPAFLTLCVRQ